MIKSTNFFVVQGWMLTELKLSGNNLIVYAIIFGFSHIENQRFTGSRKYLAEASNTTTRTIQTILDYLTEKEFIIKFEVVENNVKFCEYAANIDILCEFDVIDFIGGEGTSRVVNKVHQGDEVTSHNNYRDKTVKEKKEKKETLTPRILNEDFSVSDEMIQWAEKSFPGIDPKWLIEDTENFKDYYIAKGSKWRDWVRVWQKWIRTSEKKRFIEKKNPPSDSPGSPQNPDFIKGTQIEKFEKNPDGSFNRKKYSTEAMKYIKKNHKNLIDTAYIKFNNGREKLTENETMLLEKDYEEYCKHWGEVQEAKNKSRK